MRVIDALWRIAADGNGVYRIARLKYGGLSVQCDLREMLHRQFYFFGTYFLSEGTLTCWEREAQNTKVIFDVGANAGIFSLAAVTASPNAAVHAFEPTPELVAQLRETAETNHLGQLCIHEVAVWSGDGRAVLTRFRGEDGSNAGMNFVTSIDEWPNSEVVRTIDLDEFCRSHGIEHIDLLKLDIQGNEHRALEGATELLREGRIGVVFTELNWAENVDHCSATKSVRILEQSGYRFSEPGRHLRWRRSGPWLRDLSEVIARRLPAGVSADAD